MRSSLGIALFAKQYMGTLITVSQFILALAILVTLHELGHFLAARAFGIRVEKFYLFFDAWGFKLFSFKRGDTEYGIGWLPLGGYVKIAGMIDESLDTEQLKSEIQPWEFRGKPAWQRLIVMLGGVIVNFILGMVIFGMLLWANGESYLPMKAINENQGIYASPKARAFGLQTGDQLYALNGKPIERLEEFFNPDFLLADQQEIALKRNGKDTTIKLKKGLADELGKKEKVDFISVRLPFSIGEVTPDNPAAKAGLKKGDSILAIDGKKAVYFFEFKELLNERIGKSMVLTFVRNGQEQQATLTPNADGTIGIATKMYAYEQFKATKQYGFGTSMVKGASKGIEAMYTNIVGLGKVITGEVKAKNAMRGPIGMAQMYGDKWDWEWFWTLTAILSLGLAFANLLPIPALDGGHVVFLLWEMITGKPVSEKVLYVGQIIGMVIIFSLIGFLFWNDIARILAN